MAEMWEKVKASVRGFLPAEAAEHETEVVLVAVVTTLLALLGEQGEGGR